MGFESKIQGKMLLFAAPSGGGKTTIVRHLLQTRNDLAFSVSATSRPARAHEVDGKDYYFLSKEAFKEKIKQKGFAEWEEVYSGVYYGTMKSELERLWTEGKHIVFDVDVKGALNIKRQFGEHALAVFVSPPSLEALQKRLEARGTESVETLQTRLGKAAYEISFAPSFDVILINDDLQVALKDAEIIVEEFLSSAKIEL